MMNDLLQSENVHEIMRTMALNYASGSVDKCNKLLALIPNIAAANMKRMTDDMVLCQQAVNVLEYMIPEHAEYPYGLHGVLSFVYAQCNFKRMYEESLNPNLNKHMLTALQAMRGRPGIRAVIPQFKDYVDDCRKRENWREDMHWNQLDCEACKEMVDWCIKNPDKWDDLGDYRQKMEAFRLENPPRRGRPPKEWK